jgi:dienelactone hydrolase
VPEEGVAIRLNGSALQGDLVVPPGAKGIVLFAHGSGSSRHSPRNRYVARALQQSGLGSLLIDLLTRDEERRDLQTAELRFDINLLTGRLEQTIDWLQATPRTGSLRIGLFGASTGAAAALVAASRRPEIIRAVVSRGGRPDLAGQALSRVRAPTLLIVGGADAPVVAMNREAMPLLTGVNRLEIVAGASHLFEEPGALERVAQLAAEWFNHYLKPPEA